MQVDPIKLTLKAPGIKLLKLEHDKSLSNFAFKFNLRCYIEASGQIQSGFGGFMVGRAETRGPGRKPGASVYTLTRL